MSQGGPVGRLDVKKYGAGRVDGYEWCVGSRCDVSSEQSWSAAVRRCTGKCVNCTAIMLYRMLDAI